jgi:hypothetical protein
VNALDRPERGPEPAPLPGSQRCRGRLSALAWSRGRSRLEAARGAFVEDEAPVVFLKEASPARRSKPASPNDRLPVLVNARGKAAGASSGPRLPTRRSRGG